MRGILKILVTDWCKAITPTTLTLKLRRLTAASIIIRGGIGSCRMTEITTMRTFPRC